MPCILFMEQDKKAVKARKAAAVQVPSEPGLTFVSPPHHTPASAGEVRRTKAMPTCIPAAGRASFSLQPEAAN